MIIFRRRARLWSQTNIVYILYIFKQDTSDIASSFQQRMDALSSAIKIKSNVMDLFNDINKIVRLTWQFT